MDNAIALNALINGNAEIFIFPDNFAYANELPENVIAPMTTAANVAIIVAMTVMLEYAVPDVAKYDAAPMFINL